MAPSSRSAETASNPSGLPSRFEVRQLEEKHIPWATAIVIHSNIWCSPLWPVTYPNNKTQRSYEALEAADYLVRKQIVSGLSFGVFDTEYKYNYPDSEATEGKLCWNSSDLSADRAKLLEQMDFPLCSVALSYDGSDPLEMDKMGPLIAQLPAFASVYHGLNERDQRDPKSYEPTGPRQMLMRNATSTREDYEGYGIMGKQARWLMRQADAMGFRGINIECAHDAVTHVWSNPPAPYKSLLASELKTWEYEEKNEETGEMFNPFGKGRQRLTKIHCYL